MMIYLAMGFNHIFAFYFPVFYDLDKTNIYSRTKHEFLWICNERMLL